MSRLIDAKATEQEMLFWADVYGYGGLTKDNIREILRDDKKTPTVDAVEVIRCSQCKHQDKGENESGSWNCCSIGYCDVEDDYFCWWAERRQDGTACNNY